MDEMRILVVGDTHGNTNWLQNTVIPYAAQEGASKVVQVGDFGLVMPGAAFGVPSVIYKLNKVCAKYKVDLHFLPGNHDDYDQLDALESEIKERSPEGHIPLARRVFYTGKVSTWWWGGHSFAAVGGGVSIDKLYRHKYMVRTGTRIWWPQEELTREEVDRAVALGVEQNAEVLFTHDCPAYNPFDLKQDLDSSRHQGMITEVARAFQPKLWFHGHIHVDEQYLFMHDTGKAVVRSLNCDGNPMSESTELLRLPVI